MTIQEWREVETVEFEQLQDQHQEYLKRIPPWKNQITVRGLVASFFVGVIFSIIVMKLVGVTTRLVPNLNVSTALVAFVFVSSWTKLLHKAGIVSTPFTRQENTVIQTCAVACYTISLGGGFGSYILGLNRKTYEQAGVNTQGNNPGSYKEPGIGWITTFLFVTAFVGLLALVPLRKIMIIDYKLTYPSGTATAVLINGFHTPKGDKMAKEQVRGFVKVLFFQLLMGVFPVVLFWRRPMWILTVPDFWDESLETNSHLFFFDFSLTCVGAGMICSHLVNLSLLLGAVLSWGGVMWPLIHGLKGEWYPATLSEGSMKSLTGYKVFISIALILGDGLYNFLKVLFYTTRSVRIRSTGKSINAGKNERPIHLKRVPDTKGLWHLLMRLNSIN